MKLPRVPPDASSPKRRQDGMTLIELLAVMAIIFVIMGTAAMGFVNRQAGLQLSTSIVQLQGIFTQARLAALGRNKYVQVRFYKPTVGTVVGYEAVGLFLADSPYYSALTTVTTDYDQWTAQGVFRPEGKTEFFPDTIVIPSGTASQLLTDLAADPDVPRTGVSSLSGRKYAWVAFYFRPNGSTDFLTIKTADSNTSAPLLYPVTSSFLSVVPRTIYQKTAPSLPTNFATFTFTPINGACGVVRP